MSSQIKLLIRRLVPKPFRTQIVRSTRWPPVGRVNCGDLRRLAPLSRDWGFDRGLPIDRYYIDRFLSVNSCDIQGHVLEIGDNTYTIKFGNDRVCKSDVLHLTEDNPKGTIVGDLTRADNMPSNTFDCIICTQTLQFIFGMKEAIGTLQRVLKQGGVLLATVPGISQISRYDMDHWGDYWRFTTLAARTLFEEVFTKSSVTVHAYGNVLAATAFLHGLATEELHQDELDYVDPDYQLLISVRAVKLEETA